MSVTEERTRAALHEEADALLVTDEDLRRLEDGLADALQVDRVRTRPDHRRVRDAAVAAVAVLALVVSGVALWRTEHAPSAPVLPAGPGPEPSTAGVRFDPGLVGLWRNELDGAWLWQISASGTIGWDDDPDSYLTSGLALGRLVARHDDVYDIATAGSRCPTRIRFVPSAPDTVVATVLASECQEQGGPSDAFELDRVSGRRPASAPHRPVREAEERRVPRSVGEISGSWLEPVTGTVLVIGSPVYDGAALYVVDDDGDGAVAPDQRGLMTLTAAGGTRVEPDPETARGCAPTFSDVVTDRATMTTTAGGGACVPAGTTQTWVALN